MRHIRLLIEYDGTSYHGWQSQKEGGTIQDTIRAALEQITGEQIRLTGAGRTDAGVHALGQVAAFATSSMLLPEVIMRAMNAKLPSDIRILRAEETGEDFHPRYSARQKSYFYLISINRSHSAFLSRYCWTIPCALDPGAMEKAAQLLIGEHDFSAFMGSGCSSKHQVRTVHALAMAHLGEISFMTASMPGKYIKIRIEANAFLRHMVRNIVGTLVEVGRSKIPVAACGEILESRDRTKAGPTAPAHGLFLERIIY
ncbi:MAG: tRNA pseudouridine(38-40) synthase TruA [Nitrospiraceae bacterium]|nr:tRNA pseudouridine(38-40) synthase TruA [Nitrospiraceae bacterium]